MKTEKITIWTSEQTEYLSEWYGQKSLLQISKDLGLDFDVVENKKEKMGLGRSTDYKGFLTANKLAETLEIDNHRVLLWIEKKGLPHTKKILAKTNKNILIDIEEFWDWAEKNQSLINFSKIKKNVLPPEPYWVDEARKRDYHTIPKKQQQLWTKDEDSKLWYLFYTKGYKQEEIAKELNRSRVGVQRRLSVLRKKKAEELKKQT